MTLTFWGAAQVVTGSLHLVTLDSGQRIMLDCGLFQGRRADAEALNREWPCDPASVHAVLLSHAHIDHSGRLPALVRDGFRGTIWCTHATRDLCALMLRDSAHIQVSDAERTNRRHKKQGKPPVEPLYGKEDAERAVGQMTGVPYGFAFEPAAGVRVVYRDAGHILGSATMTLDVTEDGQTRTLGFTGDLGNPGRPILRDPEPLPPVDWIISESTYGGKEHEPVGNARERLREVVQRTVARGGRLVVPAFSVGRTQELVYALDRLEHDGRLPDIPVFVDSPARGQRDLGLPEPPRVLRRRRAARDAHRPEPVWLRAPRVRPRGRALERTQRHRDAVRGHLGERHVRSRPHPAPPAQRRRGRAEHGPHRRLHGRAHARPAHRGAGETRSASSARCTTCAPRSRRFPRSPRTADEPGLVSFIRALDQSRLKQVFLVHGEPDRQALLTDALAAAGVTGVEAPRRGQTVRLT